VGEAIGGATVMVGGGAGFVGSAVVRELLARDCTVVSFDNYLHGSPQNVAGLAGRLHVVHGDALEPYDVTHTIAAHGVEYIIDCIGDTFVPTAYKMPKRFFDINLYGTYNLLRAIRNTSVKKMLYVSSTEVYGQVSASSIDENAALLPTNTYAVSKLAADRLCFTFAKEHDIPVVIARIFNCYGPRETEPYIIPEIIRQLHRGNVVQLGNVKAERDFTFVHDTARALIALLESDLGFGDACNVGSNCSYSVEWLVEQIARIMNVEGVQIVCDPARLRRLDIERFVCNNAKLRALTNWEPRVPIADGLAETVEWFHRNGNVWSWEAFADDAQVYR
jgi:nucleoside-diphosphate-sugar epimerase